MYCMLDGDSYCLFLVNDILVFIATEARTELCSVQSCLIGYLIACNTFPDLVNTTFEGHSLSSDR
jgi:hypothetical protein